MTMADLIAAARIAVLTVAATLLAPNAGAHDPGESMTQERLQDLILEIGNDVLIGGNVIQFEHNGVPLICVSDPVADRMRIVSPIIELAKVESDQLLLALAANFHTVLDVRYAISDGAVYAAYIHPLSPLTEAELVSAIDQVAIAQLTFGSEYSSGALIFDGGDPIE